MSSPASNFASSSCVLIFFSLRLLIQPPLVLAAPPYGNDSNSGTTSRDDGSVMFTRNSSNDGDSRFIRGTNRHFDDFALPKFLSGDKVNSVFDSIRFTLGRVEFKIHFTSRSTRQRRAVPCLPKIPGSHRRPCS